MKHNFWLPKPYGLTNQKLCYIQICKSWRKRLGTFWRIIGEYAPVVWWGTVVKFNFEKMKYLDQSYKKNQINIYGIMIV